MLSNNNNNDNNKPDIVLLEKEGRVCFIVDVACPFDTRVAEKEQRRSTTLRAKKWKCKLRSGTAEVYLSSLVIGALGTVSKQLHCKDVAQ